MKKIFAFALILLLIPGQAFAYYQEMYFGHNGNLSATATAYWNATGRTSTSAATSSGWDMRAPIPGTFSGLYVQLSAVAGAAKSYTFTLYVNGSPSTLTCQVTGAVTATCTDYVNSVSVVQGDLIVMEVVPSGTPAVALPSWRMKFQSTNSNQRWVSGANYSAAGSSLTNKSYPINIGFGANGVSSSSPTGNVMLETGNFESFFAEINVTPAVGTSYTFTLYQNGSATAMACTISNGSTSCTDTTHPIAVAPKDYFQITSTASGTPGNQNIFREYLVFNSTSPDNKETLGMMNLLSGVAVQTIWDPVTAGDGNNSGTSSNTQIPVLQGYCVTDFELRDFQALSGAGTVDVTLEKNSVDTVITGQLTSAIHSVSLTGKNVCFVPGDTIGYKTVVAGATTSNPYTFDVAILVAQSNTSSISGATLQGATIN